MSSEFRDLGMNRRIARRDFLNGVAIAVTGAYAAAKTPLVAAAPPQAPAGRADYPPALTGLRGQYPAAVAQFDTIQKGGFAAFPRIDVDTREHYDLVVVGGGISGLAAAYFWHRALPNQKVLVLDNHDDFGGHAKRNEFSYGGRTFIGYGGTMGIATPYPYSYTAKALVADLGIDVERNREFATRALADQYHLGPAMFFDKEHFGEDRLVVGNGRIPWPEFFAKAPLSDDARKDLIRLYGRNPDYLEGLTIAQKEAKLAKMSYQDYLLQVARIAPDAIPFFMGQGGRNNKRVDTIPALEAARRGSPGFDGLGFDVEEPFKESSYLFHFPDGNASLARLLVARLVPTAIPGKQRMETIVQAPVDYAALDAPGSATRIRLSSAVVRVGGTGGGQVSADGGGYGGRVSADAGGHPSPIPVAYVHDGKMYGVAARHVVLACYNSLIPGLVPELPEPQKSALLYSPKVPMMYNNVLVRNWTAFQKLGASSISGPCLYHTSTSLDPGSTIGGYRGVTTPDEPIIVHLARNPNKPGLPRKEQNRIGQQELLSTTFEQFELEIRRQLGRMLAGGGFDPARDIVGITVNRWPLGYAYTYDTLGDPDVAPEQRPHVVGRQRFGSIAIANADAGAAAFTNQAIDEAHRAVEELLVARGLT